ncbi:hypothetical protein VMCG_10447 [Cytospora schulzeri]|uniref:Uncharacterized protein n=1 Tax=Cytospora schulzeri TaxID=448051 RepID=A0A423VBY3_9PEZI|nr:hypothetical protein VMCG_10447 [Valsa malicola]
MIPVRPQSRLASSTDLDLDFGYGFGFDFHFDFHQACSSFARIPSPLAIRQDATTNKMRNLHTSRTSSKEPAASASSSSARMPYDRSIPSSSSSSSTTTTAPTSSSRQHPQMPTLAKRTTLTPKLAANKPSPTPSSQRQTVTLATPLPRKSVRPESYIAHATTTNNTGAAGAGSRDNHASPVPSYFPNNLTPRSGPRQSRAESPSSSIISADLSADINWDSRGNGPPSLNRDSKFFYASDAQRSAQPMPVPAPKPAPPQKGPVFFYANGDNLPAKPSPPTSVPAGPFSPPLAASASDPRDSKFLYANGTPDLQPSLMMTSGSGSVVSTSSRMTSTRPGSGPQSPAASHMPQRTTSPPKISGHPPPPPPPSAPQTSAGPSIAERRSMLALSTPQLGRSKLDLRRISAEGPQRKASGHSRSGSLVAEPSVVSRPAACSPPLTSPLPSPMAFSNTNISMASVLQAADDFAGEHDDNESIGSGLASPRSANGNDPLNDLVANARRERKVQDLQITNASLEAINRTLERQLRKQTNELRRYKRMSRAGRLSSANTIAPTRKPSGSTMGDTPEGPLNDLALSDLSEGSEDPEDGDLDESDLSDSDSTGSAQTSSSTAMRDARHQKRDEKRLQIDLSKHQQLLVDSQKMNQSLKRCLGWTEELIREGKRALEYQVRISEEDIGGHGAPEEGEQPYIYDGAELWDHNHTSDRDPGSDDDGYGHLGAEDDGDADETMKLRIERLRPADESNGNKNAQDRDSGIVLPGDGG